MKPTREEAVFALAMETPAKRRAAFLERVRRPLWENINATEASEKR